MQAMREAHMRPGVETYLAQLVAYGRRAQWEQMDAVMSAMRDAGLTPDGDGWGVVLAAYEKHQEVCVCVCVCERAGEGVV